MDGGRPSAQRASGERERRSALGLQAASAPAAGPSRFGFQGAAASSSRPGSASASRISNGVGSAIPSRPSSRLGTVAGPSQAILGSKRSLSGAGLVEMIESPADGTLNGHGATKRRMPSVARSTDRDSDSAGFSRGPTPSPTHDLSTLENEYRRRELLSQQAYEKLQQEYMARCREADKHKQDRMSLLRQWEALNAEVDEERQANTRQRKMLSEQVDSLNQSNKELSERALKAEADAARSRQTAHVTKTDSSLRISSLEAELATAQAEVESQKQYRSKLEVQLEEQEAEFARSRQTGQVAISERKEDAVAHELSSLLSKTRKLETENLTLTRQNRELSEHKSSVQALKEQNRSLEKKAGATDELRRKVAELESANEDLTLEVTTWRQALTQTNHNTALEEAHLTYADTEAAIPDLTQPEALTPQTLMPFIARLRGAVSGLAARRSAISDRIVALKKQSAASEDRLQEEVERRAKVEGELERARTARLVAEKNREVLATELESYKRLLDTFQQEAQNMSGNFDAATAEQIGFLETQLRCRDEELAAARRNLAEEQAKLEAFTASGSISALERERIDGDNEAKHKSLIQELEQQRISYAALEKECAILGKANDDLLARVGRGEFDQNKLRCLELSSNPVTVDRVIRTSMLERLRKENDDLLVQVQALSKRVNASTLRADDETSSASGMVPAQTLENVRSDYAKLEQTMRDRDKAFDRLKQVFAAKASEYVAAVKTLFGYDMHVVARGKIKLRSVYARTTKGTSLTFDSADDDVGSMRLVGEARAGAANVAHLKKYWLQSNERSSVPCFLAALQLELYESTTQAIRSGWAEDGEE